MIRCKSLPCVAARWRRASPIRPRRRISRPLGFPGELVENWQEKAIVRLGELVEGSRALKVYLDCCVKCGACTDKCHYFLGTGDPKNMPVARQDLLRKVYRRHFTWAGRYMPWLVGAEDLTRQVLDDWYSYFHQCSQCRRCSVFCPYGIDTAEISMAAREIMDCDRHRPEVFQRDHRQGPATSATISACRSRRSRPRSKESKRKSRRRPALDVRLPLDVEGAEILLVTPECRLLRRAAHREPDRLRQGFAPGGNQLDFQLPRIGSRQFRHVHRLVRRTCRRSRSRIRKAAQDLGVKRLVFGECGHAWRVAYNFLNTLAGPFDFLDPRYPIPQHICEFTYDLMRQGKLKFDKSKNDHIRLTFHNSCNVARASRMGDKPGGQFEIPRASFAPSAIISSTWRPIRSARDAVLRRRRRPAYRRTHGTAHQGRAAAHARAAARSPTSTA